MTVLIDPPLWPKHGTVWSHLVSDTSIEELRGVRRAGGDPRPRLRPRPLRRAAGAHTTSSWPQAPCRCPRVNSCAGSARADSGSRRASGTRPVTRLLSRPRSSSARVITGGVPAGLSAAVETRRLRDFARPSPGRFGAGRASSTESEEHLRLGHPHRTLAPDGHLGQAGELDDRDRRLLRRCGRDQGRRRLGGCLGGGHRAATPGGDVRDDGPTARVPRMREPEPRPSRAPESARALSGTLAGACLRRACCRGIRCLLLAVRQRGRGDQRERVLGVLGDAVGAGVRLRLGWLLRRLRLLAAAAAPAAAATLGLLRLLRRAVLARPARGAR